MEKRAYKVFSVRDWSLQEAHKEKPVGASLTVPDETYSIRQIVEKFTTGMNMAIERTPVYDSVTGFDSQDLEKVPGMDLYDRQVYHEAVVQELKESEASVKKQKADEKARLDAEAREMEELKAELKAKKQEKRVADQRPKNEGAPDA